LVSEPRENTADVRDIRVAVFLPESVSESRTQLEAVAYEVRFAKSLQHENVIRTFGLEAFHRGWARIVEYVDGEPLSALIQAAQENEVRMPVPFSCRILLDLCAGSSHAYSVIPDASSSQLRVHGGLRPDTVMVSFAGVAKLTGYGASALQNQENHEINSYRSPEQIIGGPQAATEGSDVYALGAILYTLLTGCAPFANEDDLEDAIMTTMPSRPELDGLGGELLNLALQAMSKRVQKRFESVAAFRVAIERAAKDQIASTDMISVFIDDLIPPESMERAERTALLGRQDDLSLQTKLEYCELDQWDEALFQDARVPIVEGDPAELDLADDPEESDEESIDQRAQETMVVKRSSSKENLATAENAPFEDSNASATDETNEGSIDSSDIDNSSAPDSKVPESSVDEADQSTNSSVHDPDANDAPQTHEAVHDLSLLSESDEESSEEVSSRSIESIVESDQTDEQEETTSEEPLSEAAVESSGAQMSANESSSDGDGLAPQNPSSSVESDSVLSQETVPDVGGVSESVVEEDDDEKLETNAHPEIQERMAPDRAATEVATSAQKKQIHVTLGPSAAHETTSRIPGRGFSRPEGDQWKNESGLPAAVPRAPIRDDSITAFRKNVGDNSRSMLFVLLLVAGGVLFSVYYFGKQAAPELSEGNQRQISYKEIAQITQDGQKASTKSQKPRLVAPTDEPPPSEANDEMVESEVLQEATFELTSVPELSASTLFDTEELDFGRTPISVKLKPGKYRIRLTDEEKRINVYREFEIKGGGVYREKIELLPGTLAIRAPKDAELEVDGLVAGKAPVKALELYEGKHRIKMTYKGKSKVRWIEMAPGAQMKVNFLKKK